ncbi:hypothetical protein GCM10009096_16320 [Parasphingorhabdus litoris]|uniref:O-antigen ligase-related domain-containing protein n=2 Tax=Parasphingorhabdus litoris TaxID=394733 RepID=A0ABN1AFR4_9SPHN
MVVAALFSFVIGLTLLLSRSLAFDRLFGKDIISDMRGQVSSTLESMAQGYFPFGSGFGSFEHVFKQFETYELLRPTYLNQAHNDWLQFVIEGGLPAILLLIALLIWLVKRSVFVIRLGVWTSAGKASIMSLGSLSFCAAASIVDYPLRVPTLMAFAAVMLSFFADNSRENSPVRGNRTTPVEPS